MSAQPCASLLVWAGMLAPLHIHVCGSMLVVFLRVTVSSGRCRKVTHFARPCRRQCEGCGPTWVLPELPERYRSRWYAWFRCV